MSRTGRVQRGALAGLLALALLVAGLLAYRQNERRKILEQHPRIVLVSFDTLHTDYAQPYNPEVDFTPNLQAFAAEGLVFEHAYTTVPITLPSHASMLTGRPPADVGAMMNGDEVDLEPEFLPEILGEIGYRTAAFISLGAVDTPTRIQQGFEHFAGDLENHPRWYLFADEVVEAAAEWIRQAGDDPFFAWVHLSDPHGPYQPRDSPPSARLALDGEVLSDWDLTSGEVFTQPVTAAPGKHTLTWTSIREPRSDDRDDTAVRIVVTTPPLADRGSDPSLAEGAPIERTLPWSVEFENTGSSPIETSVTFKGRLYRPPPSRLLDNYPLEVAYSDRYFGELRRLFEELGLEDETLWAVVSDHGEGLFRHGKPGHANDAYDDQLKVMWMLEGPGIPSGRRIAETPVLLEDLLPTLLDLLDISPPRGLSGASLTGCWGGGDCPTRTEWWAFGVSTTTEEIASLAAYSWPYKALWRVDEELKIFNLTNDPIERRDLVRFFQRKRQEMPADLARLLRESGAERQRLLARLREIRERSETGQLEALRALGYLDDVRETT